MTEISLEQQNPPSALASATPPVDPPSRLRLTYDYIKKNRVPDVADALPNGYDEFEAGMVNDPDNVKALHAVFKEQGWEGGELDERGFTELMLPASKKKKSGPTGLWQRFCAYCADCFSGAKWGS